MTGGSQIVGSITHLEQMGRHSTPLALRPVLGYPCSSVEDVTLKLRWTFRVKAGANSFFRLIACNEMSFPTNASFNLVFLSGICKLAFNLAAILLLVVLMKRFIVAVVFLN